MTVPPMLGRLSLRLRVTLAFAGAMALLLGALGLFVYARVQSGLDRSLSEGLRSRAEDVRALVLQANSGLQEAGQQLLATPGERFAQILTTDGRVLDRTPSLPPRALLSPAQLSRASAAPLLLEHKRVPGLAGSSRLLAIPVRAQDERMIVVVGTSLQQHDATLADLRTVLLLGGPVALLLASLLGYAVAALALRAVERMRRRAEHISLDQPGQRLPVPSADDELRRLSNTLNEMLARNEAAFARERTFVADASHELRSPLAILRTELDVALLGESSRAGSRDAIASAAEEAGRLSRLAEDLLTLAEADQASLPIHREAIDVGQSLERLKERFASRARTAGAVLLTRAPRGLRMRADPLRLEQALGGLIDNALRYGAKTVEVQAECSGETVLLHVSDDGPGFPPRFLETAFERFTRANRARTAGVWDSASRSCGASRAHTAARRTSPTAQVAAPTCGSRYPTPSSLTPDVSRSTLAQGATRHRRAYQRSRRPAGHGPHLKPASLDEHSGGVQVSRGSLARILTRTPPLLLIAFTLAASGCGGSSGTASSSSSAGGPAPESAAALSADAKSAATGDIPDTQNFLTLRAPQLRVSMLYPEGWTVQESADRVSITDKNNLVRIVVSRGAAATTASVQSQLATMERSTPGLKANTAHAIALKSGPAVKVTYTTQSAPNPVTGKQVTLMVDRYVLAHSGRVAVVDLGTPVGVDNVDAYRRMIESFKWL